MRVVIGLAALKAAHACDTYLKSPEWDAGEQALVYPDWAATVARHIAMGREGIVRLDFLVSKGLVPMTKAEFAEARKGVQ